MSTKDRRSFLKQAGAAAFLAGSSPATQPQTAVQRNPAEGLPRAAECCSLYRGMRCGQTSSGHRARTTWSRRLGGIDI